MVAVNSSETSMNFCHTIRCHIAEENNAFHSHRYENLKSIERESFVRETDAREHLLKACYVQRRFHLDRATVIPCLCCSYYHVLRHYKL
jgi:hypothetical protein